MATKPKASKAQAKKRAKKATPKTRSTKKVATKNVKVKPVVKKTVKKIAPKNAKQAKKSFKFSKKDIKAKLKVAFTPGSTFLTNLLWVFITVVALMLVDFFVQYINNDYSAAKVNNGRITMSELEEQVLERSGEQVLEDLIQKKLIEQAAEEAGVEVSEEEVEKEYKRIEKLYGKSGDGAQLEDVLKDSGYTKESYMKTLKLELLANKVLVDDPSEETLVEFFATNKDIYFTTQETYEDDKDNVERTYIQVEFQDKVQPWLDQIQNDAVIVNNIKEKPEYGFFLATRDSFTSIYNLITDKK